MIALRKAYPTRKTIGIMKTYGPSFQNPERGAFFSKVVVSCVLTEEKNARQQVQIRRRERVLRVNLFQEQRH